MRSETVVSKEEGLGGGEVRISVGCLVQSQTTCHVGRGRYLHEMDVKHNPILVYIRGEEHLIKEAVINFGMLLSIMGWLKLL